jgi:hypothetical protein
VGVAVVVGDENDGVEGVVLEGVDDGDDVAGGGGALKGSQQSSASLMGADAHSLQRRERKNI